MVNARSEIVPDWTPLVRVGWIEFGASIDKLVNERRLEWVHTFDIPSERWSVYRVPGTDIEVTEEAGVVVRISCDGSLLLNGVQLIGIALSEFTELLGCEPDGESEVVESSDGVARSVYEFPGVGAQVWVLDDVVETVILDAGED